MRWYVERASYIRLNECCQWCWRCWNLPWAFASSGLNNPISFSDAAFANTPQPFPLSACPSPAFLPRGPAPEFLLHVSPGWSPVSCGFWSPLSCVGICSFTDSFTNDFKHLHFYKWVPGENRPFSVHIPLLTHNKLPVDWTRDPLTFQWRSRW